MKVVKSDQSMDQITSKATFAQQPFLCVQAFQPKAPEYLVFNPDFDSTNVRSQLIRTCKTRLGGALSQAQRVYYTSVYFTRDTYTPCRVYSTLEPTPCLRLAEPTCYTKARHQLHTKRVTSRQV